MSQKYANLDKQRAFDEEYAQVTRHEGKSKTPHKNGCGTINLRGARKGLLCNNPYYITENGERYCKDHCSTGKYADNARLYKNESSPEWSQNSSSSPESEPNDLTTPPHSPQRHQFTKDEDMFEFLGDNAISPLSPTPESPPNFRPTQSNTKRQRTYGGKRRHKRTRNRKSSKKSRTRKYRR